MFGHFATECFFPGGMLALEKVSRQPYHRRLSKFFLVPGTIGGALVFMVAFAGSRHWLSRSEVRFGAVLGFGLVGVWWLIYIVHRDFLMARYWSHKPN